MLVSNISQNLFIYNVLICARAAVCSSSAPEKPATFFCGKATFDEPGCLN
jgi:hypothetical protein